MWVYIQALASAIFDVLFKGRFLIRINYSNGQHEEFWCYSYKIDKHGTHSWRYASGSGNKPVSLVSDTSKIVSVWQVKTRPALIKNTKSDK